MIVGETTRVLLLTLVAVRLSSASVDWVSSPVDQAKPLNGSATFDCLVGGAGVGDRTVLWTKKSDGDLTTARRTLFINEAPFDAPSRYRSRRVDEGSGYRLIIDNIATVDDADYTCEIQLLGKASAHLTVLGNSSQVAFNEKGSVNCIMHQLLHTKFNKYNYFTIQNNSIGYISVSVKYSTHYVICDVESYCA